MNNMSELQEADDRIHELFEESMEKHKENCRYRQILRATKFHVAYLKAKIVGEPLIYTYFNGFTNITVDPLILVNKLVEKYCEWNKSKEFGYCEVGIYTDLHSKRIENVFCLEENKFSYLELCELERHFAEFWGNCLEKYNISMKDE